MTIPPFSFGTKANQISITPHITEHNNFLRGEGKRGERLLFAIILLQREYLLIIVEIKKMEHVPTTTWVVNYANASGKFYRAPRTMLHFWISSLVVVHICFEE